MQQGLGHQELLSLPLLPWWPIDGSQHATSNNGGIIDSLSQCLKEVDEPFGHLKLQADPSCLQCCCSGGAGRNLEITSQWRHHVGRLCECKGGRYAASLNHVGLPRALPLPLRPNADGWPPAAKVCIPAPHYGVKGLCSAPPVVNASH